MIIIAIKYAYQNCEPLSSYHGILISHVNYHTGHDVVAKLTTILILIMFIIIEKLRHRDSNKKKKQ